METAKASLPDSVTPQELAFVLDCFSTATVPKSFGETYALSQVVSKLVALANQPHPIGAVIAQPRGGFPDQLPLAEPEITQLAP